MNFWFKENFNSVRDYFCDVFNGVVNIKGEVVGLFYMLKMFVVYVNGLNGIGLKVLNVWIMVRDVVKLVNLLVNFKKYDNDKDGFVDVFVIVYVGVGGEIMGNFGDIWLYKWVLENGVY